jgi:hypothetical protein
MRTKFLLDRVYACSMGPAVYQSIYGLGYGLNYHDPIPGKCWELFYSSPSTDQLWDQSPTKWVPRFICLGLKRPEREADNSPPFSAEVKNAWSYTCTSTTRLNGAVVNETMDPSSLCGAYLSTGTPSTYLCDACADITHRWTFCYADVWRCSQPERNNRSPYKQHGDWTSTYDLGDKNLFHTSTNIQSREKSVV